MSVEDTQPLITHLIELRKRLLNCIISVIVIFLCLVYFANDIYHLVSAPLIKQLPQGSTMIATDVASPFFTPIKLTFMVSLILSAPVILYQVWAFIAPALYKHERRLVVPLLVSSSLLFYIGMAFAYFVVFPLAFGFLANTAPEGVQVSTDIASYLSFVMALFMAFGVSFEVPVAIVLLCWMGITSPEDLRKKRPYVLVGAFVVGMFADAAGCLLANAVGDPYVLPVLKSVSSSHAFTLVKGETGKRKTTLKQKAKKLKNKFNRPSGRLSYGVQDV
ncbi:Sec-independent protein translocase protein [Escherichia coli]|uniref:Sec-independent protein translocase protein TatC n=7 Tax=Gammaproteobacteria TaxID=1236 RepID=A0A376WEY4_ECOLX|nr:Sec-independent protein translocase protein [Escherichia coli]